MTLPLVRVPRGMRVVPYVASALANAYGLDVFCLTDLARHCEDRSLPRTMLAETCEQPSVSTTTARWSDPRGVCVGRERQLSDLVDICAREGRETERPGFWQRLQHWANVVLTATDRTPHWKVSGRQTQWNAGHGFSLVRLETSGPAVWFKAVGPPNEAESRITALMADRHPDYTARLLAAHDAWCGWLTEEVPGQSLRHDPEPEAWTRAATDMARLQLEECSRADSWLQSGCVDLRVPTLGRKADEFFSNMESIFEQQVKTPPPRLLPTDLKITVDALHRALGTAARLPGSLVHADLNPDNVFFQDGRAVFLDWAGASVGFPFTALENFCGHLRRCRPADSSTTEGAVREAFCAVWKEAYGAEAVDQALAVAPMLRYASLAMRSAGWLWQTATPASREPLLRSLTRSMYQAARAAVH
jgi:Phosphotransferase enzyme family